MADSTEDRLADAVTKLTEVAEHLSEAVAAMGTGSQAGAASLDRRTRHAQNAKVVAALAVGALLAALIVPNQRHQDVVVAGASVPSASSELPAVAPDASPTIVAGGDGSAPSAPISPEGGSGGGATAAPASPASGARSAVGGASTGPRSSGPGVTDKDVTIGVVDLDSSDLATVCPRCGNGPSKDGLALYGLLAKWHAEGRLPVNGRDIKLVRRQTKVVDTGQRRAACVEIAQQVKPFAVLVNPVGSFDVAQCLAKEFKQLTISFDAPDEQVLAQTPTLYTPHATIDRIIRNYVYWAHDRGLFKSQTLGLYCCADADVVSQQIIDRSLKPALAQFGYKLAVEVKSDGQQTAPLAVQRFRAAGVTTALLFSDILAFQQAAKAQLYKPRYPMPDTGYNFTDAVADITFDADQMDGNYGMRVKWWNWSQRKPVKAIGNPAAQECVDAYQSYSKRSLDSYDNDAELEYTIESCALLQLTMKALELSGPNLSQAAFQQAMTQVKAFQIASFMSDTFSATRRSGADMFSTWQFKKARWQPTNEYFGAVSGWTKFYVE